MGLARFSMEAFVPVHTPEAKARDELLRPACDTLACMPETMTKSISVTGRLRGVEGEALDVLTLTRQLAAEHGPKEVVEMQGHCFTARFWRRDPGLCREGDGL